MKLLRILLVFTFCAFLFSACTKQNSAQTEYVLGTFCTINLYNKGSSKNYKLMFDRLKELDQILSANRDDSNIAEINQNAGIKPVKAKPETLYVLQVALQFSEKTQGSYDPTIGPLVKLWNIGTTDAAVPSKEALDQALSLINYKNVLIDPSNETVFLTKKGMKLDLGANAKGYAADELVRIIQSLKIPRAIIDLGGNVFAYGEKAKNKKWVIGIRDPIHDSGKPIMSISVTNKTIVTSGVYERFFEENGIKYHHILDPNTGYPVQNDLLSVTIISSSSILADTLSTSLFVLGAEKGKKIIDSIPETEAIFVFTDKHIEITEKLYPEVNLLSDEFYIR